VVNADGTTEDERARQAAETFGMLDGRVAFLAHCGSRGFGHDLASGQFRALRNKFETWDIPMPASDPQLVYAPLGTPEADAYLDDMALGANFATVNHLLINALVLEAFQEILPGVSGGLVYFISHNIARPEIVDNQADPGAEKACYSVNHGAGRAMGRKAAMRALDQEAVDRSFAEMDILTNCRAYPRDEAPAAYKDFDAVLDSVKKAGLASEVARLAARFVIKDASAADD
jgi:tRNA-splicing ligase RtcB